MIILTDADGVLCDYTTGYLDFVKEINPDIKTNAASWDFGIDPKLAYKYIQEFNRTPQFGKLESHADSQEYVEKLKEKGFKFVAVTTCLGNESTEAMRKHNLNSLFGSDTFHDVICLPIGSSKLGALETYKDSYYIDDKLRHSIDGIKAGHKSFFMIHDYNKNDIKEAESQGIIPVKLWKEIYLEILDF